MLKTISTTLGAVALSASAVWADAANKDLVINMMTDVFAARDARAVETYFAEDYIQRNPMVPSGTAPIIAFLSRPVDANAPARPANEMHRIIAEGDLVATHSTLYSLGPKPLVAFDVFRIEDGKIAEHWDNLIPRRAAPNAAGRTQVDGSSDVTDLDLTDENKARVLISRNTSIPHRMRSTIQTPETGCRDCKN
jgi:predicted SnoaL-like aldol condensation-catalyzing enzyme